MICTGQLEKAAFRSFDDVKIIGIPLSHSAQSTYLQLLIIHKKLIDYWNN
jgi:hypothetical protein